MIRILLGLLMLGLAPLGSFLGPYLEGARMINEGFLVGITCTFVLPWLTSGLSALLTKTWPVAILVFLCGLSVQAVLMFKILPPRAEVEMMGAAYRYRHEYPVDQIRLCADKLREEKRDGSLKGIANGGHSIIIDETELPVTLRGKFAIVMIRGDSFEEVFFAEEEDERSGIICDQRKHVWGISEYSIAEGVHAYRYLR